MPLLTDILYKVRLQSVQGSTHVNVNDLQIDSRKVLPGSCFIAIEGTVQDGHAYIETAVTKGAVAIVCRVMPQAMQEGIVYVQVANTSEAVAWMSNNFFKEPSARLKLVGVTGTNGKTTIATVLFHLFTGLGFKCGLLSTVQNQIADQVIPATHTTPDAISLNELLRRMADEGCTYAFMECSSHAIHQHRITGLHFAGGIFSNITHDHLDYHKTFAEYINVKKSFFDHLPPSAFALSNLDDKRGTVMLQNTPAQKLYYSLRDMADFKGKMVENSMTGLVMNIDGQEVHFRLMGEFNAYNLLAVYGAAVSLGIDKNEVLKTLSNTTGAEGRFDYIISPKEKLVGIVDYAHTPDALLNVLATIRKIRQGNEQVITVVGCGGDRDKTKRPVMAQVACEFSDRAIFTSDNPRSEDAEDIINDMTIGLESRYKRRQLSITDRREAIKTAVSMAQPKDIILVAGKGHEKYQEIKGVKHHFDDKEELAKMFELLGK
jgi:UDP-N-acetylmuramoyl-L-alanyl-D-glutamate--2,6-diaminopimelate ligase